MRTGEKQVAREKNGHFKKGTSGNAGGRPKVPEELKEAFKAAAPDALQVLKFVMLNSREKASDRLRAAEIILDRGYGKPVQAVDLDASSVPQVVFVGDVPD